MEKLAMKTSLPKPRDGAAAIYEFPADVKAALAIIPVAVVFGLCFAELSHYPLEAGLYSAIIAGVVFPLVYLFFKSGPNLAIGGAAAGLAPVLVYSMTFLGRGDEEAGRPYMPVVIFLIGLGQIIFSIRAKIPLTIFGKTFRLGIPDASKLVTFFPQVIVVAMFAAIGLGIIPKQVPHFVGYVLKEESHGHGHQTFLDSLWKIPVALDGGTWRVALLGLFCLGLIFLVHLVCEVKKGNDNRIHRFLRFLPGPTLVVVVGVIAGRCMGLEPMYCVQLSGEFLPTVALPSFSLLLSDPWMIPRVLFIAAMLGPIDVIESLTTAEEVSHRDPWHRRVCRYLVLLAIGLANWLSSLVNGMTVIPGVMKSSINIAAGGRTYLVNFYVALGLIGVLVLPWGRVIISLIPTASLAAVLIYIGWKLCRPKVWAEVFKAGWDQFVLMGVTVAAVLTLGIFEGMLIGLLLHLGLSLLWALTSVYQEGSRSWLVAVSSLFCNPLGKTKVAGDTWFLPGIGPFSSFNGHHVKEVLERALEKANKIELDLTCVPFVDCSMDKVLHRFREECEERGIALTFVGLDSLQPLSTKATCTLRRRRELVPASDLSLETQEA